MILSNNTYLLIAPMCANSGCKNTVQQYAKINKWKEYCCRACFNTSVRNNKIKEKLAYLGSAPVCCNSGCNNKVNLRTSRAKGVNPWSSFCSLLCRNTHNSNSNKSGRKETWECKTKDEFKTMIDLLKKSSFKFKDYKFPSGKIVKIQGYEYKALDELLVTYHEDSIYVNDIPIIEYIGSDNRKHFYHPDIYIPEENLIIEVKSKWTYSGKTEWLATNILKEKACISAGFNFRWMIY